MNGIKFCNTVYFDMVSKFDLSSFFVTFDSYLLKL